MILAATQVYVIGLRASNGPAQLLAHNLNQMLGNAHCLSLADDSLFDQLRHVKPEDVIIAITFSRYSVFTFQAVRTVGRILPGLGYSLRPWSKFRRT
ncbi:MAG TPA: SIS domain-containing protein [Firmicutes bacterium]|nr:SIS domain-containing protein [Candidatus Fermentithermobacillaceae bacterium]